MGILPSFRWKKLEGHQTSQPGVLGLIHHPIPPAPSFSIMRYRDVVIGLWAASVGPPISAYLRVIDPCKSIERIQGLPSTSEVGQSSELLSFSQAE